jgi:hypothetical protein
MPVVETLINAAAGNKILSFMDGNAGYNQIFMAPEDIHKTTFRVPSAVGLFEYVVMTFGLKNAGATYQCPMNYIYHDLISKLVGIYIDNVVVKSTSTGGHLGGSTPSFWANQEVRTQDELEEVCIHCISRSVPRFLGSWTRNWDQPKESRSSEDNGATQNEEGASVAHWQDQFHQEIYLQYIQMDRAFHGLGED